MSEDWREGGFALYVHWPFCEAKCPYCDFNSHVVANVDQDRWARALAAEIARSAALTPGRVLKSIFFGGGTPSLMKPETVETVLRAARDGWTWANDIEITLEANPRSVEAARFQGFASAGVNRVSLGVQALNDADLRRLGRLHSAAEAQVAFDTARDTFDRVSFDLIYARQNQTLADWETELRSALALAVDHMSLYQLTIEPGTAFGARHAAGGLRGLPDEDLAADMYELTQALCEAAGYPAYEVSNHARPGAESRHNLVYWHYGDYVGVGPGAHGRVTIDGRKHATEDWTAPGKWLEAAEAGSGHRSVAELDGPTQAGEYMLMGLRVCEGVDIDRLERMAPGGIAQEKLAALQDIGVLWKESTRFGVTARGRMVLNAVVTELLPDQD
ncbi:radical SAM family heme chaperone HemW [Allosediminivita pacifica]|uniref:Heme chaperone HemW n=1 Tax=Allosediminivita pacifica TaxID=1267769 RepID=A0A2T6B5R5_9RHOB|nr:radical SAM family heme chaperone HemW [Allosediminivita pacifica]PTX51410.1 oxygen-independent coproporphyrinogen-3 oxidase [Allosediminivita pacifica]GGA99617.1 coproporphyrinogen III oxidase [Allosediminivita pacifica]